MTIPKTIRKGSVGSEVKQLTGILIKIGYLNIPKYESWLSIFGPRTEAAVRDYQSKNTVTVDNNVEKLDIDGIVGPKTWKSLLSSQIATVEPQTPHFKLYEMNVFDNRYADLWTPAPSSVYPVIQDLFEDVLEPLRHKLNEKYANGGEVKLIIRSGWRNAAYNARIGGAGGSQHLIGKAADVYATTVTADGKRLDHTPNCYLVARAAQELWPWENGKPKKLGWGIGSNTNLHLDIRDNPGFWPYTYTWDNWEANQ
jgi:hypothetical protein